MAAQLQVLRLKGEYADTLALGRAEKLQYDTSALRTVLLGEPMEPELRPYVCKPFNTGHSSGQMQTAGLADQLQSRNDANGFAVSFSATKYQIP